MKKVYKLIQQPSFYILFFVFVLTTFNRVFAQQAIGSYPNIDAGFEGQNAGSFPVGNPNTSTTLWSYVSSGNGQTRLITTTGGYGGPKYLSVGKTNPTTNTSTTVNSNIISTGSFSQNTKYIIQFHYKQNLGTPDTTSFVFVSMDGTSGARDKQNITLGTPSTWTKFSKVITTNGVTPPTTNGVIGINIKLTGTADGATSGVVDVDNFVVYKTDDQNNPAADITAPNAPTGLSVSASTALINLSWSRPNTGVDGGGFMVVRYSSNPSGEANPLQNAVYKANASNFIGTKGTVVFIGDTTAFSDATVSNDSSYFYRVYAVDKAFNYSSPLTSSSAVSPLAKINYYYDGSGSTADLTNWWTNKNGTGTHPSNFSNSGQVFRIITNADLVSGLNITGLGSALVIGAPSPGVNAVTVSFNSSSLPGIDTIYQSLDGSPTILNFNTANIPSINILEDISTEVHYRSPIRDTISSSKTYYKIVVENGADVVFSGSPIVTNSFFVAEGSAATIGTLSSRWLTVNDGATVTINGKITTPKLAGLVSSNVGTASNVGGAIQFIGVGDIVLGTNSTVEYSGISTVTTNTQNITPRTDYRNMIISGVGYSKTMSSAITIPGTFTMNTTGAGGLILSGGALTINGALTLTSGVIRTDTINILTLGTGNTIIGGYNNSYVFGPVKKSTNSTSSAVLPTGKNGLYRSVTITPSAATASTYQAEFFNSAYTTTTFDTSLVAIDTTYWNITKISGASASVSLKLDGVTAIPNSDGGKMLVVSFLNGANWKSLWAPTGTSLSINPSNLLDGTAKSTLLTTFGKFTLGLKTASGLPLNIVSFKGNIQNNKVQLTWSTTNEVNVSHFEVEESSDGIHFKNIGVVMANNSTVLNKYSFSTTNLTLSTSYYRIKIQNNDGKSEYSQIVLIRNTPKTNLVVLNNPIHENRISLQCNNLPNGKYSLKLYNSNGQLTQQQLISISETSKAIPSITLKNTSNKGVYIITLTGNGVNEETRFILD